MQATTTTTTNTTTNTNTDIDVMNDIYFNLDEIDQAVGKKSSIIVRSSESNQNFTAMDAGNEATDNSFDAAYLNTEGQIKAKSDVFLVEEEPDMLKNDQRFSMIIADASGGFDLKEAFSPNKEIVYYKEIYTSYEMLRQKMGAYNTGLKSYTNIGTDVMIATKLLNGDWQVLWLNRIPGARAFGSNLEAETDEGYNFQKLTVDCLIGHLDGQIDVQELKQNANTIVYIKNISNDINEKGNKRISNMEQLVNYFKYKKGIAYSDLLEKGFEITVNGEQVVPISPFVFPEAPHLIRPFFKAKITLRALCKTEKYLKDELWDLYGHLFETVDKMLDETMEVIFYYIDKAGVKKLYGNKTNLNVVLTNTDTSGLYPNRNGKRIGKPIKIEGLFTGHPSYNGFRAEAKFSPLFDKIFGIGSNKNNHKVMSSFSKVLRELLCEENILQGDDQLLPYLKTLSIEVQTPIKKLAHEVNVAKKNQLQLNAVVSKAKVMGIDTQATPANMEEITPTNVLAINGKINAELKKITSIVDRKKKEVIDESDKLAQRLQKAIKNRKALLPIYNEMQAKRNLYEMALLEPNNEGELYGTLEKAMILLPHKFSFKILDYNEKSGLDSVIVHEDMKEYRALNMEQRIQLTKDPSEKLPPVAFCEYKYLLVDQQNIGHSLAVASYLLCWNKEETVKTIVAQDGIYSLVEDEENNLIFKAKPEEYGGPEKIVKLILLQPLLEQAYGEKFEGYSNILEVL